MKIFPLALLEDRQLLALYPGSEGAIPTDIQPRRNAHPFTGLLVAGVLYDYYRIVDAHHLSGYDMKLTIRAADAAAQGGEADAEGRSCHPAGGHGEGGTEGARGRGTPAGGEQAAG